MNAKDLSIIERILEHCESIEARIEKYSIDEEKFTADSEMSDLLLMPLVQIGELAAGLSEDFRKANHEIPWQKIKDFRNLIVHDYDGVNLLWTWNELAVDLPELKDYCSRVLAGQQ